MQTFYYTFGTDEQFPYQRGWVEVIANNIYGAHEKFKEHFPSCNPNILNCAYYYTESQFWAAGFKERGNFGIGCHEVIK